MTHSKSPEKIRIIKKYQNRRLYDTEESIYITLQDVKELVMLGTEFVVQDATSGDDVTRQTLLGIILEEEAGGVPLFSNQLLRQLISFYGNTFQTALGRYLEGNLRHFSEVQGQFQEQMRKFMPLHDDPAAALGKLLSIPTTPNIPNIFGSYLENSKKIFELMTESFRANPWSKISESPTTSSKEFAKESVAKSIVSVVPPTEKKKKGVNLPKTTTKRSATPTTVPRKTSR